MSKHTPGPWLNMGNFVYALNADGENIFSAYVQDAHTAHSQLHANAILMAAAPDLLEALELMVTTHDEGGWPTATITIARAAIAKAKGEQQ